MDVNEKNVIEFPKKTKKTERMIYIEELRRLHAEVRRLDKILAEVVLLAGGKPNGPL